MVVVGAGAMGSATAWWLARRGRSVALLEQFEAGHRKGSSHGGTRIFRFAYDDPLYARLAVDALGSWRELEADTGSTLLEITGGVDHGPRVIVDTIAATLKQIGARHECLGREEAAERFAGMLFDESVVYSPDGGRCYADLTVRTLQERVSTLGGSVHFNTGRAVVENHGDYVVVSNPAGLSWHAPVAVITAGAWVEPVLGGAGAYGIPPMVVSQEQICHFAPLDANREWPSFIHHGVAGLDSAVYGLRTPGEGVKVGGHHEGPAVSGDDRDFVLDPRRIDQAVAYVERWFPGLDTTPIHGATCLYTTAPTKDFVLDRVGPLVIGSPCSGHGFKFTPEIGRILADIAQGGAPPGGRFSLAR